MAGEPRLWCALGSASSNPRPRKSERTTSSYAYDAHGEAIGEYDGTGALIEETVWLGDIPVATLRPHTGGGVDIFYVHTDQLNTPRAVTRPSDNLVVWSWYSDPFGTDAANENPAGAGTFKYNLRFAGQTFDGQAGLHDNGYRDFDPATGRYVESDPIGLHAGINTYAYAEGNALSRGDPLGLFDGTSAWQLGWEWLTGTGPRHHDFQDGDPFAEILRQHDHIQELISDLCQGAQGRDPYSTSGVKGVGLYFKDYSNVLTGGHTGNLAVTYLGSYQLNYSVTDSVLIMVITNTSSMASATHPPILGYTHWWDEYVGQPLNRMFETGPMSATTQAIILHQSLSSCGCSH
jgi:RHS repeat-associated protein